MNTRKRSLPLILALCMLTLASRRGYAQTTNAMLLEQAYYLEEISGRLDEAITLYRRITEDSTAGRSLRASARIQIARCLEKRGESGAYAVYRDLVEKFPEQHRIVAAATLALERLKEPAIPPLVEWYCRRIPLDPMTAFSRDGRYQVITDWASGNLVVKDWKDGSRRRLTGLDSVETGPLFAYHGVWSDDTRLIAFSQYVKEGCLELRTVTVKDGRTKLIYTARGQRVFPQDWNRSSTKILCEIVRNTADGSMGNHFLAFIGLDGSFIPLVPISSNSRGLRLSPDDHYLAYDRLVERNRHIFIYDIRTGIESRITSGVTDNVGFESPVWSRDGQQLLYRSQLRGRSDLWAIPVAGGSAAGPPELLQSDLTGVHLTLAQVGELHGLDPRAHQLPPAAETATLPFREEFASGTLSNEWHVWCWSHSDVYGNGSFGRYSLAVNPGFLRYSLDPMMHESWGRQYIPAWDKWSFCYYPSTEISRLLTGRRYRLEFRVVYSAVTGANDRRLTCKLVFHPRINPGDYLLITRNVGATAISQTAIMYENFTPVINASCQAAADTVSTRSMPYRFVITRQDTVIALEAAVRNESLKPVITCTIPAVSSDVEQILILSGNSWFVPALTYADWDYVDYTPLTDPGRQVMR